MIGETNLDRLLVSLNPVLNPGEFVFASLKNRDDITRELTIFEFKEKEGITVVLSKDNADKSGLSYHFVASWITLEVHSSLEAIGLTAAFAAALSEAEISCNVVAGFYHDHIFVGQHDAHRALQVLRQLSEDTLDKIS